MEFKSIDGLQFRNMVVNGYNHLLQNKDTINALNVFPVPDGDTGTNMLMTFKAAVDEIKDKDIKSISEVSKIFARGALMGARGNSGVILSQIFRGIAKGFEEHNSADAKTMIHAIAEGSKSAYKAVMKPTEGTVLTIIRTAAEFAVSDTNNDITVLLEGVYNNSEVVLKKTPDMLPVLKKAKVVDSGAMGLVVVLKGMYEALKYDIKAEILKSTEKDYKQPEFIPQAQISEADIKFGYCTEFIIMNSNIDQEKFKSSILEHGDSIVVVGSEDIIKVHIHTNDPGTVLSKAVMAGELSRIKIDNMREEHREALISMEEYKTQPEEKDYAFIAVAAGEGISKIFKELGADIVIEGGQTMNPSTQDILAGINTLNAKNIVIFPNNKNIIMASEQAAQLTDKNIIVLPTRSIPQGIACLTVYNPEDTIDNNTSNFKEAIKNVKSANVTYAVRDTELDGFEIKEGNILGLIEEKISEVGTDIYKVTESLLGKMIDDGSALITLYYGQDCNEEEVNSFAELLSEKYEDLDVSVYYGTQPLYYFIISVE